MNKLFAVTSSTLVLILAACGSQVVEFPVSDEPATPMDAGPDTSIRVPDAGKPDATVPDAGKPDSSKPDTGTSDDDDAGSPDDDDDVTGDDDDDNTCNQCGCDNVCQCKNKCNDELAACKTTCENECTGWEKKKCLYQCQCKHSDCVSCCK